MTVIRLAKETEALAHALAKFHGVSVEEAVKMAVEATAGRAGTATQKRELTRDELIRRMEEISARSAARPLVDPRSPDELLGYDDFGLPR